MEEAVEITQYESARRALSQLPPDEILAILEEKLIGEPKIDTNIVARLGTLTAQLQKKVEEANLPQVAQEAQVLKTSGISVEKDSIETEGRKWTRIIRDEKGAGGLRGKFSRTWRYSLPDGSSRNVLPDPTLEGSFTGAAWFDNLDKTSIKHAKHIVAFTQGDINNEYQRGRPNRANFLIVKPLKDKSVEGWVFNYASWLNPVNVPDSRGATIPLQFAFILPSQEGSELFAQLVDNPDLAEEIFQNIYPDLTGKDGNLQAQRMITDKLIMIDRINSPRQPIRKDLRFSHPVGEVP